jgi:hypothetical protein
MNIRFIDLGRPAQGNSARQLAKTLDRAPLQPYVRHAHVSFAPSLSPEHPPPMKSVWTGYYCRTESVAADTAWMLAAPLQLREDLNILCAANGRGRCRGRAAPAYPRDAGASRQPPETITRFTDPHLRVATVRSDRSIFTENPPCPPSTIGARCFPANSPVRSRCCVDMKATAIRRRGTSEVRDLEQAPVCRVSWQVKRGESHVASRRRDYAIR